MTPGSGVSLGQCDEQVETVDGGHQLCVCGLPSAPAGRMGWGLGVCRERDVGWCSNAGFRGHVTASSSVTLRAKVELRKCSYLRSLRELTAKFLAAKLGPWECEKGGWVEGALLG